MDFNKELAKIQAEQQKHVLRQKMNAMAEAASDEQHSNRQSSDGVDDDLPDSPDSSAPAKNSAGLILPFFALLLLLGLPTSALQLAHMSWNGYALSTAPAGAAIAVALAAIWGITWAVRSLKRAFTGNSEGQLPPNRWALKAVSLVIIVGLGILGHVLFPDGLSLGAYLGRTPNTAEAAGAEMVATEVATDAARPIAVPIDGAVDAAKPAPTRSPEGVVDAAKPADSSAMIKVVLSKTDPEELMKLGSQGHSPNDSNAQGQTAVHIAVLQNDPKALHVLLLLSGRGDQTDRQGQTALHLAVLHTPQLLAQLLQAMTAGAQSLDTQDAQGNTALMLAAAGGNSRAVDLLILSSAALYLKNRADLTAEQLAKRQGHAEIAKQLMR
jgi:hypothetical protein